MLTRKLFRDSLFVFMCIELSYTFSMTVDWLFISRFSGSTGVAAMELCRPLFVIAGAISGLWSIGLQERCSVHLGKGDVDNARKVFASMFALLVLASVVIVILGFAFTDRIISLFGAEEGHKLIWNDAGGYFKAVIIGLPAMVTIPVLSVILQMDSDSKLVNRELVVWIAANIAGDFINGYFFGGSIAGMGLATTIANYTALALMLTHFLNKNAIFTLRPAMIPLNEAAKVFEAGTPKLSHNMCMSLRPVLINRFVFAAGAEAALAAYSVQNSFFDIAGVVGLGAVNAVLLLGGVFFSERDDKSLSELASEAFMTVLYVIVPVSVLTFIFAPRIAAFYITDSPEASQMASYALRALAAALPLQACAEIVCEIQHVSQHHNFVHIFTVLNGFLLPTSCVYILGTLWGTAGIWAALPVSSAVLLMFELAVIYTKHPIRNVTGLYGLGERFAYNNADDLEASPITEEEVIELSSKVSEFCEAHNVDDERAYRFALCVEEMGINVIRHGFSDGKPHEVGARIIYDNGDLIFRLRDDCSAFDIKERAKQIMDSPPEKGIGIKLTTGSAKDLKYIHVLETNTIIITV